jgi:hypothetical protein
MATFFRLLLTLAFWLALSVTPALAQGGLRIIPVPPGVKPQWQAVQGAPKVSFAPNIPTDVFRYRGRYYLNWDGMWFESRTLEGPWDRPQRVPRALGRIHTSYFKTAPGRGPSRPGMGQGPPAGTPAGPQSPGAFQPPGAPSGMSKRDAFSVPGVAPPPGWTPPTGSGMAEPIPPADVTPPGGPSSLPGGHPGPEGVTAAPEGAPEPGEQVPRAM